MCVMDCHTQTAVKRHHMQPLYTELQAEGNKNVKVDFYKFLDILLLVHLDNKDTDSMLYSLCFITDSIFNDKLYSLFHY